MNKTLKKILIGIAALVLIFVGFMFYLAKQADFKTYKYFETIVLKDNKKSVIDTIYYMYPIFADDDEEGYVKAYEMYLANDNYLKSLNNIVLYEIIDFKVTDEKGVKLIVTPSIDRKLALINLGIMHKDNIIFNHRYSKTLK